MITRINGILSSISRTHVLLLMIVFVLIGSITLPLVVSAHRSGCHRWHSCPSDSGSYTCGDWGYSNYCPTSPPAYIYQEPVVSTKDEIETEVIKKDTQVVENPLRYPDYSKDVSEGRDGEAKRTVTVTYTDGVETKRSDAVREVVVQPEPKIIEKGVRMVPVAHLVAVKDVDDGWFGWDKGKFNVMGTAPKNTKVALSRGGKIIAITETNSLGFFSFEKVAINDREWLEVGEVKGLAWLWFNPRVERLSEKAVFNLKDGSFTTEYDTLLTK